MSRKQRLWLLSEAAALRAAAAKRLLLVDLTAEDVAIAVDLREIASMTDQKAVPLNALISKELSSRKAATV